MGKKALVVMVILLLAAAGVYAYSLMRPDVPGDDIVVGNGDDEDKGNDEGNDTVNDERTDLQLPAEIQDWVEYSRQIFLGQKRVIGGKTYVLVTYGERPTGGYLVDITDLTVEGDRIVATVDFKKPGAQDIVTEAITYPYDLKVTDAVNLPVEFSATGDEEYVPGLINIDYLKPVEAESESIKIFSPAPDESVSRQFIVEGIANVFEGTVLYLLMDSRGNELQSGFTTATMGDWGFFNIDLSVSDNISGGEKMHLQLFTESARDGSVQDLVEIPLTLQ